MIMAIKPLLLLIFFSLFFLNSLGQITPLCEIKNKVTQPGETLSYEVFYKVAGASIKAAKVIFSNQLETYQGRPVYHIKSEGHTLKSYDWFFKVRDLYESYIDTANMKPLKFVRNVHEGNNVLFNQALFNHEQSQVLTTNGLFNLPACTQDILSAVYYCRNVDFSTCKINDKIPLTLYLDDKTYPIYVRYLGKEKITTPLGTFQTIKFKPLLIEGTIFSGGENMMVYVSDDENKIPLLVETPILIGQIKVYLVNAQRIKFPFRTLLK
jgi:hypothetical protein